MILSFYLLNCKSNIINKNQNSMKRKFSILFFIMAFAALVVMPTGETVKAYEKQQIETLESDLNLINNDVEFKFTENSYPIMIVEVEISYGDNLQGVYYFEGSKSNSITTYSYYALNYSSVPLKEVKPCLDVSTDNNRYEQANKLLAESKMWYCSNNYLMYSIRPNSNILKTSANYITGKNHIESKEVHGYLPCYKQNLQYNYTT